GRVARWTTAADGSGASRRGRLTTLNAQYANARRSAPTPKIGRNTKGGFEITSNPLRVVLTRAGVAASGGAVGSSVGEGGGDSVGVGAGGGEATGARRWKCGEGFGWT